MPTDNLDEVGEFLCGEVRAGSIDVDDANNRWERDLERVRDELEPFELVGFMLRGLTWVTSEIWRFVLATVALFGTLVVIAVHLKKLNE